MKIFESLNNLHNCLFFLKNDWFRNYTGVCIWVTHWIIHSANSLQRDFSSCHWWSKIGQINCPYCIRYYWPPFILHTCWHKLEDPKEFNMSRPHTSLPSSCSFRHQTLQSMLLIIPLQTRPVWGIYLQVSVEKNVWTLNLLHCTHTDHLSDARLYFSVMGRNNIS